MDKGTRERLLDAELGDTIQRLGHVVPEHALDEHVVPAHDVGLCQPVRKLQRELTRAAHGLSRRRLLESIPKTASGVRDRRVSEHPTDAWLPFFIAPTSSDLIVDSEAYISGLRFYLLLPQLIRLSAAALTDSGWC